MEVFPIVFSEGRIVIQYGSGLCLEIFCVKTSELGSLLLDRRIRLNHILMTENRIGIGSEIYSDYLVFLEDGNDGHESCDAE